MLAKIRLGTFFKFGLSVIDRLERSLAVSMQPCYAIGLKTSCRAILTRRSVPPQSYSSGKLEARVSGVTTSIGAVTDSVVKTLRYTLSP